MSGYNRLLAHGIECYFVVTASLMGISHQLSHEMDVIATTAPGNIRGHDDSCSIKALKSVVDVFVCSSGILTHF